MQVVSPRLKWPVPWAIGWCLSETNPRAFKSSVPACGLYSRALEETIVHLRRHENVRHLGRTQ